MYWFLKHLVVGPLVRLLFRPVVVGLEHVPRTGPVLFVSNHPSFLDPVFLAVAVRRPISFLAKSEYFTGRGLSGLLTKRFFLAIRQLPIHRDGGRASADSLGAGRRHLEQGGQLGIYPEGTRSPDGLVHRGRTGVARLVLDANVPIIPVGMIGTEHVMPIGSRLPRLRRVELVFGPPLELPAAAGGDRDLRGATDAIMLTLAALSRREYVDTYVRSRRDR